MSKVPAVRRLVAERLEAAAEEIFSFMEEKLLTSGLPREQQKAAVHQHLSVIADEILRILEAVMGEQEAEVSGSCDETDRQHHLLSITLKTETNLHRTDGRLFDISSEQQSHKTSNLPQTKDADFIQDKQSHHQQRAEKFISTMMRSETPEERNKSLNSPNYSEAGSDNNESELNEKPRKSNGRRTFSRDEGCCKTCGRAFVKSAAGKKKQERNSGAGRSRCRVCGKFFRYKRSFLKHALVHEQTSDVCGACGKHLDSGESLKVHLETHSRDQTEDKQSESDSEGEWKVSEGDGEDDEKSRSKSDKPKEENKSLSHVKYSCQVCGKAFCYRASFLKHVQEDEAGVDLCGVCGKRFESEDSLKRHLQTHVRTNDCEVCGKRFESCKQLEMHVRTHTGEKPFICSVCGKTFAQNGNLMGHMRAHTGEKPYACSVCGQSFGFKEYMTAHMRIHTGEKPFLCSVCGKGFRQRGTLKTHMMIHTGESTHRCGVCDKKFYKSGALKIHMRSHTGEKPYLCNVCGKSFSASGSLSKHMGVHEGRRVHEGQRGKGSDS